MDYGSGRPANGTPREALPQCAATAPSKTSRNTASYCMARPARAESSSLRGHSPAGLGDGLDAHAPAAIAFMAERPGVDLCVGIKSATILPNRLTSRSAPDRPDAFPDYL